MEFNILQYLPENIRIRIDNDIRKMFFEGKSVTNWSKVLNISLKNSSRYINGTRSISLILLKRLIGLTKADIDKLQNKIEFKIGKSGSYHRIGPSIDIDKNWVYISELINGDGHIPLSFWQIVFVNKNEELINYVKNFFLTQGIREDQMTLIKREDANFIVIRAAVLAHIFNKILKVSAGKKMELTIPNFVMQNKNLSIAAVKGAFDSEGSVTFSGSRRISISSNSKNWLNQIKQVLENLRISSTILEDKSKRKVPIYRIFIYKKSNLEKFLTIINPLHTKRKEKLKEILNNYTRNPSREFHKKILLSIQKGNIRKRDISKDLNLKLVITQNNINWLKKKQYIFAYEKIITNEGGYHKYKITSKGKDYLNKSLSFFD